MRQQVVFSKATIEWELVRNQQITVKRRLAVRHLNVMSWFGALTEQEDKEE